MTVFTNVTDAPKEINRPLTVTTAALPAVETVTPDWLTTVPANVPPPAPLIVAAVPTCQNMFLACAPLVRMTLWGLPGPPTVSVVAIWKTQPALALPCPSSVTEPAMTGAEPGPVTRKLAALTFVGSIRTPAGRLNVALTLEFPQTAAPGDGLTDSTDIFAGVEGDEGVVGGATVEVVKVHT